MSNQRPTSRFLERLPVGAPGKAYQINEAGVISSTDHESIAEQDMNLLNEPGLGDAQTGQARPRNKRLEGVAQAVRKARSVGNLLKKTSSRSLSKTRNLMSRNKSISNLSSRSEATDAQGAQTVSTEPISTDTPPIPSQTEHKVSSTHHASPFRVSTPRLGSLLSTRSSNLSVSDAQSLDEDGIDRPSRHGLTKRECEHITSLLMTGSARELGRAQPTLHPHRQRHSEAHHPFAASSPAQARSLPSSPLSQTTSAASPDSSGHTPPGSHHRHHHHRHHRHHHPSAATATHPSTRLHHRNLSAITEESSTAGASVVLPTPVVACSEPVPDASFAGRAKQQQKLLRRSIAEGECEEEGEDGGLEE